MGREMSERSTEKGERLRGRRLWSLGGAWVEPGRGRNSNTECWS